MSLHGTIAINGSVIGAWSARRIAGGTDLDDLNTYECDVVLDEMGANVPRIEHFQLKHRYGDGAASLAAKVLAAAGSDADAR